MFSLFKKKTPIFENNKIDAIEDYDDVSEIATYFKEETGVSFDNQIYVLKSKVTVFCRKRKINSFCSLKKQVHVDMQLKHELVDYLTTNETFFYREFSQIEELIALIKKKSSFVSILCAPSATGEEPFSIAIALLESGVSSKKFSILGIDINKDALKRANEAIYKERNVRNLSSQIINRYFIKEENKYILKKEIKSMVSFRLINLFDSSFQEIGKFDFIFSRNMLIYFDKDAKLKAKRILEGLRKDHDQKIFFGHADLF